MANQTKIGDTRDGVYLRVIADITTKLANGSLTLESAKRYAKKENPFAMPQKLIVNGSDPRFQTIKRDYYFVNSKLVIEHFPISNPLVREVEYEIVEFDHDPMTQGILDAIEAGNLRRPERDEAETYFDNLSDTNEQLGRSPSSLYAAPSLGSRAVGTSHTPAWATTVATWTSSGPVITGTGSTGSWPSVSLHFET